MYALYAPASETIQFEFTLHERKSRFDGKWSLFSFLLDRVNDFKKNLLTWKSLQEGSLAFAVTCNSSRIHRIFESMKQPEVVYLFKMKKKRFPVSNSPFLSPICRFIYSFNKNKWQSNACEGLLSTLITRKETKSCTETPKTFLGDLYKNQG